MSVMLLACRLMTSHLSVNLLLFYVRSACVGPDRGPHRQTPPVPIYQPCELCFVLTGASLAYVCLSSGPCSEVCQWLSSWPTSGTGFHRNTHGDIDVALGLILQVYADGDSAWSAGSMHAIACHMVARLPTLGCL